MLSEDRFFVEAPCAKVSNSGSSLTSLGSSVMLAHLSAGSFQSSVNSDWNFRLQKLAACADCLSTPDLKNVPSDWQADAVLIPCF